MYTILMFEHEQTKDPSSKQGSPFLILKINNRILL